MTTNYNKSEIFTMAWGMFKSEVGSFSSCLKAAWNEAKNASKKVAGLVVKNVKDAYEYLAAGTNYRTGLRHDFANEIISKVAQLGSGVAQKIAESFRYNEKELSIKQAWCVAYEYMRIK